MRRIRPPRLRPGDRVAVVAPSGPVPRPAFEQGLALLSARYQLCFDEEALYSRASGFLAGSDERRTGELCAALADRSIRGVLCARGGYGLTRILGALPPSLLVADPKPLCGFSDVTALHAACLGAGLVSVHGPMIAQLGKLDDPEGSAAGLVLRLESPDPQPSWIGLTALAAGCATGLAVGGNLEVLTRLVGTPLLPPLDGAVLFLEEIAERPYRIDRQLTHLRAAGVLGRVAGVVLGDFVRCDEPDGTSSVVDVLAERLGDLGVPVVAGGPFGHGQRNRAFAHGGLVRLDAAAGVVEFLEGAVD